jgi:hypothetical protein
MRQYDASPLVFFLRSSSEVQDVPCRACLFKGYPFDRDWWI